MWNYRTNSGHGWKLPVWLIAMTWALGLSLAMTPVQADDETSDIQIDIAPWVQSPQVIPLATANLEDAIWQIAPATGRQLIQIPVTVAASAEPVTLDASTLKVVGGRFIAWRLDPTPLTPLTPLPPPASPNPSSPSSPSAAFPAAAGYGSISAEIPRLMRKISRMADSPASTANEGWSWELDRAIPGATLKEQAEQMYVYKIKPDLLEKKLPARPKMEPAAANETREAKLARMQKYQQEAEQYRLQEKAIGQLKLAAIRLPDRFTAAASARLWAVMEVRAGFTELTMEGPPPLPWKVNVPAWQVIRSIKPGENVAAVSQAIGQLTREPAHRLNHRLAAQGLADSQLLPQAHRGDMVYQSAMAILRGPDTQAKQILLSGLGRSDGDWSAVALELATVAGQSDDPATLLALLRGLAAWGDGRSNARAGSISEKRAEIEIGVRTAQRLVTWPQPSVAVQAIDELLEISQKYPAWQTPWTMQVSFSPLASSPKQAEPVVHEVIQAAKRNSPLAFGWLSQQILNPKTPVLAKIALTELAQPNDKNRPSAKIRIDAANHPLLFWLDQASPEIAGLAWKSLESFTLDDAPASGLESNAASSTLTLVLPRIMELAWKQKTLSPSLVVFLSQLPSSSWTTAALLQVAAYGSPDDLATSAAKLALGRSASDRLLEPAMGLLSPPDRQKLAARFYVWQKQPVPAATWLLSDRQARSPVAGWFARELASGRLPSASAWVAPAGGESVLLGLIWSTDANLALGAASALVASAHGTEDQARELLTAIRQSGNQSPEYAKAQWLRLRQSLLMQKLSKADGYYRLIVRLWASDSPESLASGNAPSGGAGEGANRGGMAAHPSAQTSSGPVMQASLGVVRLLADGQSVRLANQAINVSVPSEMLAIRIDRLVDLKNLNNAEVARLPLDRLTAPLDLLASDRGVWSGRVLLPDGQTMQLVLEPVGSAWP